MPASATVGTSGSAATLPFAPGRGSTTNGWPQTSESFWLTLRARMSLAPPAALATIRVFLRVGNAAEQQQRQQQALHCGCSSVGATSASVTRRRSRG